MTVDSAETVVVDSEKSHFAVEGGFVSCKIFFLSAIKWMSSVILNDNTGERQEFFGPLTLLCGTVARARLSLPSLKCFRSE